MGHKLYHAVRARMLPTESVARFATGALLALALGALLAACGSAGAAGAPGASGGSATSSGATTKTTLTPSASPAVSVTASPPTGTRGNSASCPAPAIPAAAPNPTRVVTPVDRLRTINAQVGAVIEVRLPTGAQRWSFDGRGAPTLTRLPTQGAYVASLRACVWDFTAAQTGTVTLGFVGQPNCADRQPCPQYAMLLPLKVSVT